MGRQLQAMLLKELRQTVRDRRVMLLLIVVPLVQTVVFGFAVDFEVDRVSTALVDLDGSVESRALERLVFSDGTLVPAFTATDQAEAPRWLEEGRADVVVVVPENYGRDLVRGRTPTVQALVDGTDPNRSVGAQGHLTAIFAGQDPRIRPVLMFNPGLDTPPFLLPGVAGVLLLLVTTIIAAMGLARERETGTLEQLQVTPIPSSIVLLGKIAVFVVVGYLDFTGALAVAHYGFGLPLRGSWIDLYVVTGLYVLGTLATGLAISTFSQTQQQAFLGGFLFLLPSALLSGVFTPVASMPEWLQWVTWVNPLRHYTAFVRANAFTGQSLAESLPIVGTLLAYALVVGGVAVLRFGRVRS
jgi:ABC-2 type transport system permease protein